MTLRCLLFFIPCTGLLGSHQKYWTWTAFYIYLNEIGLYHFFNDIKIKIWVQNKRETNLGSPFIIFSLCKINMYNLTDGDGGCTLYVFLTTEIRLQVCRSCDMWPTSVSYCSILFVEPPSAARRQCWNRTNSAGSPSLLHSCVGTDPTLTSSPTESCCAYTTRALV